MLKQTVGLARGSREAWSGLVTMRSPLSLSVESGGHESTDNEGKPAKDSVRPRADFCCQLVGAKDEEECRGPHNHTDDGEPC
jgi:hypothetical protein